MTVKTRLGFFALLLMTLVYPAMAQEKLVADRVFLINDPKSTSIQFQMLVLAGSSDESNPDQRGIAHYLEHLVLVGRNEGQPDAAVKLFQDGSSNGWTNQRATGYIQRFPANAPDRDERLDKLFGFFTARLTDFAITPEEAARERNVVRQEHDFRYASNPYSASWIELTRYFYEGHPFAEWTIGTPQTIGNFTVEEARAFQRKWYRKSNVYFFVTGPVPEETVKALAHKHLAKLDASPTPRRDWITAPFKLKPARRELTHTDKRIKTPTAVQARAVSLGFEHDRLRVAAANAIIQSFISSKLTGSPHSALVEGDAPVAAAINQVSIESHVPGTIYIQVGAVPEEGRNVQETHRAIDGWLNAFLKKGLDQATVDRLKKRLDRDVKLAFEEPQNTSGRLMNWLSNSHPYERLKDWPAIIADIKVDEINALLRALSGETRMSVVTFLPGAN